MAKRAKVKKPVLAALPPEPAVIASPSPQFGKRIEVMVKNLGVGTKFWLGGKCYKLKKTDYFPGWATITSVETGRDGSISNYTRVSIIK
jgi:hypothetical protein